MAAVVEGRKAAAGSGIALVVLAVVIVMTMTTWFSATAVIPQVADVWGLSQFQKSLITIAVQVGFLCGALVSAALNLSDLVPPRRLLIAAALGAALTNGLVALADGFYPALFLRFLTGFCLAGVYPVSLKLIATWFEERRGLALGVMLGALTLGSASPHLVNGLGGISWQLVILVTSFLTLSGAALTHLAVREGPFPFPKAIFDPRQLGRVFSNRGVFLASVGYFGHMWELYAMWAWFSVFFADRLVSSDIADATRWAGLATFAVIGIGSLGCVVAGQLGDTWGRTKITAASMLVSGTCSAVIGLIFDAPIAVVLVVGLVWGFAVVADSAQFSTMVSEVCDQTYVGTALTLQLAVGFSMTVITIWLVPVIEASHGWHWTFAILAPGPALGIYAMYALHRSPERKLIAGGRG